MESQQRRRDKDPDAFKEKAREYMKNKYQNDPEYREKQKARARERYWKLKNDNVSTQGNKAI
jgi:hypothetical protein